MAITTAKSRSGDLEDHGGIKVYPRSRLQSNVLTCKLVRLARPVDSGNCRRSPPKTSIPAATSGRPPVRQSALPSDHFGKGCLRVVPRFFRPALVAVDHTGGGVYVFVSWHTERSSLPHFTLSPWSVCGRFLFKLARMFRWLYITLQLIKILLLFRNLTRSKTIMPDNVQLIYVYLIDRTRKSP